MSPLRLLFLVLAVWGTLHPLGLIFTWFAENGVSLTGLTAALAGRMGTGGRCSGIW